MYRIWNDSEAYSDNHPGKPTDGNHLITNGKVRAFVLNDLNYDIWYSIAQMSKTDMFKQQDIYLCVHGNIDLGSFGKNANGNLCKPEDYADNDKCHTYLTVFDTTSYSTGTD